MAQSGTINGTQTGTRPYLRITWTAVQDVANNRNSVTAICYLVSPYNISFSASKSGVLQGSSFSYTKGAKGTGTWEIARKTFWVAHNSDGSKTGYNLSASFNINVNWSGSQLSSLSVSGNVSFDTIPRASSITKFNLAGALIPGASTTVQLAISRASTSFVHDITLQHGSTNIASWNGQGIPTSLSLTAAQVNTLLGRMSRVTSATIVLRVQTKSGSSNIGSAVTRNATASVASSVVPSASGLSTSISGSGRDKIINKYVQNISKVAVSFSSSATGGASVSTRTIKVGSTSKSGASITSGTLTSSGSVSIVCTVTDSRGRSSSVSTTISVHGYSPPSISSFKVDRSSSTPTTANLIFTGKHSRLGGDNTLTLVVARKTSTSSSYANVNTSTSTTDTYSKTVNSTGNAITTSYDFRLTVTDQFGRSSQSGASISTQKVLFDWNKDKGVSIGKMHEEKAALEVDGGIQGSLVSPYFTQQGTGGRQTSLNVPIRGNQSITPMIATSAVTEGKDGLPGNGEGYVLHFEWDHAGGWNMQMWFGSAELYGRVFSRAQQGSNNWSPWKEIGGGSSSAWGDITGKPSTFPPSSHTHSYLPLSGGTIAGTTKVGNIFEIINKSVSNRFIIDDLNGSFSDSTLRPPVNNTCNIGSSSYKVSYGAFTSLAGTSDREHKEEINPYNIDQAYEQLKDMPMYTFTFKHDQFVDHNIGTMIDYMPIDMLDTSRGENESIGRVDTYSVNNAIFFAMAALQSAQNKIERLEQRIEVLENMVVKGGE